MGFFGSFFGDDQRSAIKKADKQAQAALGQGYDASQGYYGQAASSYDPYVQTGNQANTFYANALGLNGADARTGAENTITSDPLFTGALNLANSNTLAYLNARGSAAGGAAVQAAQNNLYSQYGNWLDRYANLGAQGLQATGAKAGVLTGQGDNAYGYGATKANMAINKGNALAAADSTGINNLLGAFGTAAKFVNPLGSLPIGNYLPGGYSGSLSGS